MRIQTIITSALLAAGLALPLSVAKAQYYSDCNPFPLSWPFCIVGAAVGTAAAIATVPFRVIAGGPYYYPAPYYYAPAYYYPVHRHRRRHHYRAY